MSEAKAQLSPWRLVAIPAAITLAVTLLRLTGELLHWSRALFNPSAGGGGALVGIAWLAPLFGLYFGVVTARAGLGPRRPLATTIFLVLGLAVLPLSGIAAVKLGLGQQGLGTLLAFAVGSLVSVALVWRAWPELVRTLVAYALAARIPVAIVMLFAILGSWGTHYDAAPPGLPVMSPVAKWFWIGVVPQMTVWIAFTAATGAVFGTVAGAIARRRAA